MHYRKGNKLWWKQERIESIVIQHVNGEEIYHILPNLDINYYFF